MTICGVEAAAAQNARLLAGLTVDGCHWRKVHASPVRYGAYLAGRLGLHAPFSVIHECNDGCKCAANQRADCGNRVLQRGIRPEVLLEVFRISAEKGWGLRSRTHISAVRIRLPAKGYCIVC